MSARYAVYFAPDRYSPWWAFGAHWLGRNEYDNTALSQPLLEDISGTEIAAFTAEPRRYGFHATLKAPFRLSAAHDEADLVARLGRLARTLTPLALGPLRVVALGNFVALVAEVASADLQAQAAACVIELDDLRAPLEVADLARRRLAHLTTREAELLALYGYPYVMERFRLHLTLTGPVDAAVARRVISAVAADIDRLNTEAPLALDRLCLFLEQSPGAPFQRITDFRLHP
jgi:putative phosphonate metabolism protein